MKSILSVLILVLSLISGNAVAQGNSEDTKIMGRLTAGEYFGQYYTSSQNEALIMLYDGENHYRILNEKLQKDVKPNWIKSVDVLKDASATQKFGEEAKKGVVIVTLNTDIEEVKLYLEKVRKTYYNK